MPKLLIINVTLNQGSTGKISEQVGCRMKALGWDVYYAHGARRILPSRLKAIPFSSVRDEYIHALRSLTFDADGLGSARATKRLVKQIKKIKPDVIQIHNIHGYYLNYRILFNYLNSTDIPVVMTFHDCWNFTGHCTHFVTAGCGKWKTGCYSCPLLNTTPKSYSDHSKRNYNLKKELFKANKNLHIVTVSSWLETIVRESFFKDMDIRTIQNGIDLDVFKPTNFKKNDFFTIVGVANVWTEDKGLYDFIRLSGYLKDDERIILVGFDGEKIKEKLPNNIIPVEWTAEQKELAKAYQNSDVVISLSRAETFGFTIIEGAACGIPGIVYDNTAQPSLITEATGYVVRTGDVEGVYDAICKIREKGKSAYYESCIARARDVYDKEKCYKGYEELYDMLAGIDRGKLNNNL